MLFNLCLDGASRLNKQQQCALPLDAFCESILSTAYLKFKGKDLIHLGFLIFRCSTLLCMVLPRGDYLRLFKYIYIVVFECFYPPTPLFYRSVRTRSGVY